MLEKTSIPPETSSTQNPQATQSEDQKFGLPITSPASPPIKFPFKLIFISIVIVFSFSIVIFYLSQRFIGSSIILPGTIPPTPTIGILEPTPAITPTDSTADWKIHKNSLFFYQISYPKYGILNEREVPNDAFPKQVNRQEITLIKPDDINTINIKINIIVWNSENDSEYYLKAKGTGRKTKVNNYDAIYYSSERNFGQATFVYLFLNKGKLYQIEIEEDPSSRDPSDLSNQILSTFRFLEEDDDLVSDSYQLYPENVTSNLEDIPPLYPGVKWEKESDKNIYPSALLVAKTSSDFLNPDIAGQIWDAVLPNLTNEQYRDLYQEFITYYLENLKKLNWQWRIKINEYEIIGNSGDAPGAGEFGYVGHNKDQLRTIILIHQTKYNRGEMPLTQSCPCDLYLSVFVSDMINVSDLIKLSERE